MSDTYTWPQKCPDLVQDVSLKRARIDNEDGTSIIRTTSSSSTDVTAITQALGNQADTSSQPTVIGLLKNLIANSGGGGGGSSSYPVFKSKIYYQNQSYTANTVVPLSSLLPSGDTIPEWTKYIIFFPFNNLGIQAKVNGPFIVPKETPTSLIFNFTITNVRDNLCTIWSKDYDFSYLLENNEPAIRFNKEVDSYTNYPLSDTTATVEGKCVSRTNIIPLALVIIFLDSDPLEITGGGGGSGETVETYNLTINNVSATNITAPISDPPSADDQTLASKAYVDSQVTSKSLSYQPVSEQQLNVYTSYSIATLLGQATWDFPFSGGGSMDFVFSYGSIPRRNIWYRCHVPLPSYLNPTNTPKIYVALAQISHYPVTNDSNGELQGILLEYDTAAKTIQFIGGEGVIVNNGPDTLQSAYNQGDLHPRFWGLTCNTFI